MKSINGIDLAQVTALYSGVEAEIWELVMGEQIHLGGMKASMELADRAGIREGQHGVDLCCCNGAGMRFMVRVRKVASMTGVDATEAIVKSGRERCARDGLSDRIKFVLADATASGLPSASADFVWGEEAWCYVVDKPKLIAEAARIVRPGGTIAFSDWIEGPAGLSDDEATRLLGMMRFANIEDVDGYAGLLRSNGCKIVEAADTGRFAQCMSLLSQMVETQFSYDVLRRMGYELEMAQMVTDGFRFLTDLARAGKIAQGRFIARRE